MTKKHSTKKALMASVLSLLLCISMLVGTTFAWFTDSVTSGSNVITSGNLDIDVEYTLDGKTWNDLQGADDLFQKSLWEPGHTEVVALKIANKGSLALKYVANMNIVSESIGKTKDGKDIVLSDILTVSTLTFEDAGIDPVFGINIAEKSIEEAFKSENGIGYDAAVPFKSGNVLAETEHLLPGVAQYIVIKVDMAETVGNEANHNGTDIPSIEFGINVLATQYTYEKDSFDDQYDKNAILVTSAAEAQAALDNAEPGATIMLAPGVNYGTLYLRPVDGNANTTTSLNEANGEGLTIYRNEYIRTVEDLTILGATNAKVDAIKVESGYIANSGSSCNLVNVKGLVIDSVEFTDQADCAPHTYSAPIFFNLTWTDVDGLTVKNCKLIGNDDKVNFVYFTIDNSSAFDGVASNVTLTGNTVDGIARLCELRQTENVTITDNVIKNTVLHGMLLTVHNGVYTGNVTITGNTAYSINDRFVRMAGAGNTNVVIKDNTITDYLGEDADYIKVTDSTGTVTIENNPMTRAYKVSTSDELKAILATETDGVTVFLKAGNYEGLSFTNPAGYKAKNLTLIGETGTVVKGFAVNGWSADNNIVIDGLTIQNVTFTSGLTLSTKSMSDVTVEKCVFLNDAVILQNDKTEKLTDLIVKNCTFSGDKNGTATAIMLENTENLTVSGCTFTDIDFNVLQAGIIGGKILFDGNTVNGTGDRVFRFVTVNGDITISNNTIVSDGDADGELAKASSACQITLTNNTWNGKTDVEVADKLVNITAK